MRPKRAEGSVAAKTRGKNQNFFIESLVGLSAGLPPMSGLDNILLDDGGTFTEPRKTYKLFLLLYFLEKKTAVYRNNLFL